MYTRNVRVDAVYRGRVKITNFHHKKDKLYSV